MNIANGSRGKDPAGPVADGPPDQLPLDQPAVQLPAIGRLEKAAIAVLLLWLVLWRFGAAPLLVFAVGLPAVLLLAAVVFRWLRCFVRAAIWRLRNQLLLSFLFNAVLPIGLLLFLGWFSARLITGQIAAYLLGSEYNRTVEILYGAAVPVLSAPPERRVAAAQRLAGFFADQYPGLELVVDISPKQVFQFPEESRLLHPAVRPAETRGLLLKDGRLYWWAHVTNKDARLTMLAPLRRANLIRLVPNLGAVRLAPDFGLPQGRPSFQNFQFHDPASEDEVQVINANTLPPAVNAVDLPIVWGNSIRCSQWDDLRRPGSMTLSIGTRISQVVRVLASQKSDWDQPLVFNALLALAVVFFAIQMIAFVIGASIARSMTRAVSALYEGTQRVRAGDLTYRIPIRGHDQVAALSQSFNAMTANVERLLLVEREKERIQADLDIAQEVQEQLYPRTVPRVEGLDLNAFLKPARSVSGDYYDYQLLSPNRLAIAVGDVAGKGISAAILMANVQSALRAQLPVGGTDADRVEVSAIVSHLNRHLYAHTTPEKYATFFLAVYDARQNLLTATNAGHLPPLLFRGGNVERLPVNGMVVGAFPMAQYDETVLELHPGDLLLLYTDGITEPENEFEEMFGEERLIQVVQQNLDQPAEVIAQKIVEAVERWIHSPESSDDMTLLVIRHR